MNDVLDLDEASNYDLVLFELIRIKKRLHPCINMRFSAKRHFPKANKAKEDGSTVLFPLPMERIQKSHGCI